MSDVIQGNKYRIQVPIKRRAREALRTSTHSGKKRRRRKRRKRRKRRRMTRIAIKFFSPFTTLVCTVVLSSLLFIL